MHASSQPTGAPTLAVASEHLDRAAGAMLAAREAIAAYLTAIGLSHDGVPQEDRDWQAGLAPGQPVPPPQRRGEESRLANFWADRVDEVTDRAGARRGDRERAAPTSAELLHRA